ncbi:hypothetical protein AAMO2058_001158800 [Amorphochlora amoebiformis]
MCRWLAYRGPPINLSTLVLYPENSIINQSRDAQFLPGLTYENQAITDKRNNRVNADGFGVAWYTKGRKNACLYKSTQPSWGDSNLLELADHVESPTIFAHVRAASMGVASVQNCHPFKWKSFTFMHNGGISEFLKIKRRIQNLMEDEFFESLQGSTDSENIFYLFLSVLKRNLYDTKSRVKTVNMIQIEEATALEIAQALSDTIQKIVELESENSTSLACSLNLAITNGTWTVATRFRKGLSEPPSLYFAMLERMKTVDGKVELTWTNQDKLLKSKEMDMEADCVIISSEPLTMDLCWNLVADNCMIIVHGDKKNRSKAGKVELRHLKISNTISARGRYRSPEPNILIKPCFIADALEDEAIYAENDSPELKDRLEEILQRHPETEVGNPSDIDCPESKSRCEKRLSKETPKQCKQRARMTCLEVKVKTLQYALKEANKTIQLLRETVAQSGRRTHRSSISSHNKHFTRRQRAIALNTNDAMRGFLRCETEDDDREDEGYHGRLADFQKEGKDS